MRALSLEIELAPQTLDRRAVAARWRTGSARPWA